MLASGAHASKPAILPRAAGARTKPICASLLRKREPDQRVGARLAIEITAGGDDRLEALARDGEHGDDVANAPRLFLEIPDELLARALLGEALAVLGEDRDARAEERHRVRGDQRDPLHELQHLARH